MRYRNFTPYDLSFPLFSFESLFQTLGVDNTITLLTHLLLEHKVILLRDKYKDNAKVIELLLELMAPLYSLLFKLVNGIWLISLA